MAMTLSLVLLIVNTVDGSEKEASVQEQNRARFAKESAEKRWEYAFEDLKSQCDTTQAHSGNKSLRVDPETQTYPLLKFETADKTFENAVLFVEFELYGQNYPEAFIVSEMGGIWHAAPLARQIEQLNAWNTVQYVRPIPSLDEGSELKVYLWNPNGDVFLIDDVSIVISTP